MKRLTDWMNEEKTEVSIRHDRFRDAMIKLAVYEDLDEQGRLLELPCGDESTFYKIFKDEIVHLRPNNTILKNRYMGGYDLSCVNVSNSRDWRIIHLPDRDCFDTMEEAEAALIKMRCRGK